MAMRKSDFIKNTTRSLLFLNVFIIVAIFRQRAYADKSIDAKVIVKMALWCFTLPFCLACFRRWGRKLLRIDNVFLVPLLILIFISCTYAPDPFYSFAAAFSLLTVLVLLFLASSVLSTPEILQPIIR